jgi:hypothetical protein
MTFDFAAWLVVNRSSIRGIRHRIIIEPGEEVNDVKRKTRARIVSLSMTSIAPGAIGSVAAESEWGEQDAEHVDFRRASGITSFVSAPGILPDTH